MPRNNEEMLASLVGAASFFRPFQGFTDFYSHSRGFAPGLVICAPLGRADIFHLSSQEGQEIEILKF